MVRRKQEKELANLPLSLQQKGNFHLVLHHPLFWYAFSILVLLQMFICYTKQTIVPKLYESGTSHFHLVVVVLLGFQASRILELFNIAFNNRIIY